MRISDWSSDVCSSDLPVLKLRFPIPGKQRLLGVGMAGPELPKGPFRDDPHALYNLFPFVLQVQCSQNNLMSSRLASAAHRGDARPGTGRERPTRRDRKSVGKGKSVSVRVDLGGR